MTPMELIIDHKLNRIECPICNHTESWKEGSKSSEYAAKARMGKHLKRPDVKEASLHAELYTQEYR